MRNRALSHQLCQLCDVTENLAIVSGQAAWDIRSNLRNNEFVAPPSLPAGKDRQELIVVGGKVSFSDTKYACEL